MTILAPSWNTDRYLIDSIGDDDHPIKISTREHSIEPYKFTETDVNSGRFTAEIILTGFSHDVDGDGIFDKAIFQEVYYAIAPSSALKEVRRAADFVTTSKGGERSVAEACLHIAKKFFGLKL